ncbi:uncharacterized protein LOC122297703 [Carya illinoinensis]|uniref:uncharacterized protein LOC122297703 n=1 Tax=Carya illinoinensis TaxID=32201 RepID=UPI001C727503|nr:uncharacterized protein LOC122297703 [Carya illinoinensis]
MSHPNLSWRGDQHVTSATLAPEPSQLAIQAPPMQKKGFEDTVQATLNNQNSLAINDIRSSLTRLTTSLSTQEEGKFPAQSQPNPQGQPHQVQAISEDPTLKSVKAVTTLRSGKVVDIPAHEPYNSGKVSNPSNKDGEHVSDEHEKIHCPIPAPFPQRLVPLHKDDFEFFDCFADSSLPLQETKQMPSEWSTQNKRRFLSEQRKQFQKFCKSRWSGPYIVNPREVS